MQTSNKIGTDPIYDARTLGTPRMLVLGVQHMFAMFGATVLVPALTGLNVATTLLLAGLGTLLFHLITKGKVPAFLGSSFAFLGGYWAIAPNGEAELLPYACVGVACAGLLYILLAILFKTFGPQKVMRFFPPIVTGPIIISIGLTLSSSALDNCATNWWIALVAILVVVVCNIWGKGMVKIIPILLGVVASYLAAALAGQVDFTPVREAAWIGLPVHMENTVFSLIGNADPGLLVTSIITIMPIALATMIEHIGDICAISSTCQRNFLQAPGLHRTLVGDGLATSLAALFGGPANTTYGGKHRRASPLQGLCPPGNPHRRHPGHPPLLQPQVRRPDQRHARRHHGRGLPGALWHDQRRGRAQRGGKPGGLHQLPERDHRRPDPGAVPSASPSAPLEPWPSRWAPPPSACPAWRSPP